MVKLLSTLHVPEGIIQKVGSISPSAGVLVVAAVLYKVLDLGKMKSDGSVLDCHASAICHVDHYHPVCDPSASTNGHPSDRPADASQGPPETERTSPQCEAIQKKTIRFARFVKLYYSCAQVLYSGAILCVFSADFAAA